MENKKFTLALYAFFLVSALIISSASVSAQEDFVFRNQTDDDLTRIHGDTGNLTVTGDIDAQDGFFSFLGSVANRITGLFVQDIDASGDVDILGDLTVGTNVLFADSTGDLVGIGTITPQNKLNVIGDINATTTIYAGEFSGPINWTFLQNYPNACPAGQAVQVIGDTLTCIEVDPENVVNGTGTIDTIPRWIAENELGDSIIKQDGTTAIVEGSFNVTSNVNFLGTLDVVGQISTDDDISAGGDISADGNVTASWFKGAFNWIIGADSEKYLTFNGTQLDFDESQLNETIGSIGNDTYILRTGDAITSGSYSFPDDFTIASPAFHVDSGANRVGIGTTSPQNLLNVLGDANVTGDFYGTDAYFNGGWQDGGLSIIDGDIYAQTGYFVNISSLEVADLSVNGSLIPHFDNQFDLGNGTYRWRDLAIGRNADIDGDLTVDTDTLFVDSSTDRVGIGTTNPNEKLHVSGNITANGIIESAQSTINKNFFVGSTSATDVFTIKDTGTAINFDSPVRSRMTFTNADVGIGTSSPTDKLDVFSSSNNQRLIRISHPTAPTEASGFLGFNTDGTTNNNVVTLGVQYSSTYYDVINIQRSTRNVGIGTTSPARELEVTGSGNVYTRVTSPSGSDAAIELNETGGELWAILNEGSTNAFKIRESGGTRLTILDGGNVGIGTTSPSALLDLETSGTGSFLELNRTDSGDTYSLRILDGGLTIYNTDDSRKEMTFDGTGNVGIGTSSPGYSIYLDNVLTIESTEQAGLELMGDINTDTVISALTFNNKNSLTADKRVAQIAAIRDGANSKGSLGFNVWDGQDSSIRAVTIDSDGNVGIGTSSPFSLLDVTADTNPNLTLKSDGTPANDKVLGTLQFREDGTGTFGKIEGISTDISGGSLDGALVFYTQTANSLSESVRIESGQVGIGTTSPQQTLHVAGNGLFNGTINTDGNKIINIGNGTNPQDAVSYSQLQAVDADAVNGTGTQNTIAKFTGSTTLGDSLITDDGTIVAVDTSDLYINTTSGNVGIGTTGPNGLLEVRKDVSGDIGGALFVTNAFGSGNPTENQAIILIGRNNNRGSRIRNFANGPNGQDSDLILDFQDNGEGWNERVRFTNDGLVGIGTTSPVKTLHVNIDDSDTSPSSGRGLAGGTAGAGFILRNDNTTSGTYANLDFRAGSADGRIAFVNRGTNDGDFQFISDTSGSSPEAKMTILSNGRVGIGTDSPSKTLDVDGTIKAQGNQIFVEGSSPNIEYNEDGDMQIFRTRVSGGHFNIEDVTGGSAIPFKLESGAPSNSLRIDSSGKVGIGTSSPSQKLDVAGSSRFGDTGSSKYFEIRTSSSDAVLQFLNSSDTALWEIRDDAGTFKINEGNDANNRVTILEGGNVGIGTTDPQSKLQLRVDGDAASWGGLSFIPASSSSSSSNIIRAGAGDQSTSRGLDLAIFDTADGSSDAQIKLRFDTADAKGNILFDTSGSERMRIDSDGNVGIGTTSPNSKLEVDGTFNATNNGGSMRVDSNGNVKIGI